MPKVELERGAVLDWVIGNSDRHGSNFLIRGRGEQMKLIFIDNGLAFPNPATGMDQVYSWHFRALSGQAPSPEVGTVLQGFIDKFPKIRARMIKSVGKKATDATLDRAKALKEVLDDTGKWDWDTIKSAFGHNPRNQFGAYIEPGFA